jgi:energy-coupling factor transporter ATP-binding protein EcfA2
MHKEFIAGLNFSGRSAAMLTQLRDGSLGQHAFFIGPYAEAALSGLSSSIADEIALYRTRPARERVPFSRLDIAGNRKPQNLSGGEQVLLALHCFSLSAHDTVAVDTALEQLDANNRAAAIDYLSQGDFNTLLIDNHPAPPDWPRQMRAADSSAFAIDWAALNAALPTHEAPVIDIRGLNFAYRNGPQIFRDASVRIEPGQAHRLFGANGAGKTTLLKILVGALAPASGEMLLGGKSYAPWRDGGARVALATQNPDQQWCGATLSEDMDRRRAALRPGMAMPGNDRLAALARALGIADFDQHLYELPLAARKRVSWLWPLAGVHPWIVLDEPTVGQDAATRAHLAALLARMCEAGYGIVFVTHDDEFARLLPHRVLRVENGTISSP